MKKILLSAFILSVSLASAQTAANDDFENYIVGNIGTDLTGTTPGQYSWLTVGNNGTAPTTTTNANNSNFQIVNVGGVNGKVLQITGGNGDKGSRLMTRDGLAAFWTSRTAGNNIMEIEFDLFTGAVTESTNAQRVLIYDATNTKILSGISFSMNTKVISGVGYYDNSAAAGGAIANYLFNLGTAGPLELAPNTWVRVGLSFNYTSGEIRWKGPGFDGFVNGAAANVSPDKANLMVVTGSTAAVPNTLASVASFDNLVLRAVPTGSLLGVSTQATIADFSVYPNPATNVVYVENAKSLSSITLTDLNGRIVLSKKYNGVSETAVNVSDLTAGVYLMTIENDGIKSTKKIIKN